MAINFQDPMFLIPAGVILLGLVLLVIAVGKLVKKTPPPPDFLGDDDTLPSSTSSAASDLIREPAGSDLFPQLKREQPVSTPIAAPVAGANREMSDRLDGMAQKLSDMQTVLQRQAASSPTGAALTPETIDKLLKIIGNVTQQVDILQKGLNAAPTLSVPAPAAPSAATAHPPAAQQPPVSAPAPSAQPKPTANPAPPVGGKSIGVAGGALSSYGKSAPAKPAQNPIVPPPPGSNPPQK